MKTFLSPLTPEQENECLKKLKKGSLEARNELTLHNMRLVAHVAKKYQNSEEDMEDLRKSLNQISKMYGDAMRALEQGEPEEPEKLIRRREKVMDLDINMRKAHMDRVNKGKCKAKLSAPFTRLLHCVDRHLPFPEKTFFFLSY